MDLNSGGAFDDGMYEQPKSSKTHVRAYQACVQCRQKKQRCDMGPVDNPHPPPCASCRRESRACTFTPNRSRSSTVGTPPRPVSDIEQADVVTVNTQADTEDTYDCLEEKVKILLGSGFNDLSDPFWLLSSLQEKDCQEEGRQKQTLEDARYALMVVSVKEAWEQFEPVRSGLISAFEAMSYIDFFYSTLSPLTATTLEDYQDIPKHPRLLKNEPILAATLLSIASRYMVLPGFDSHYRSTIAHDRLDKHVRALLHDLHYIEEPVDFHTTEHQTGDPKTKLRSLGTIEALLLLMDWHPRSTHFPTDVGSTMLSAGSPQRASELQRETKSRIEARIFNGYKTSEEQRDLFLKPSRKSDQMSLSHLQLASLLATQLQLFEKDPLNPNSYVILPGETVEATRRRNRVRCLLFVHATFIGARTSRKLLYPEDHKDLQFSRDILDFAYDRSHVTAPNKSETEKTSLARDVAIHFWYRLARDVVVPANQELFRSKEYCQQLIKSGAYEAKMHSYLTELDDFKIALDKCKFIPKLMRYNLTLEYLYCRVLIANFGLQAIIWRFTNSGHAILSMENRRDSLAPIIGNDQKYIVEVVQSSRALLTVAIEKLGNSDGLRCAVHRVFLRIVPISTILLQAFMFGTTADDCQATLDVLQDAARKLREEIQDDLHLAASIAKALERMVKDTQSCLVRIAPSLTLGEGPEATIPISTATRKARGRPRTSTLQSPLGNNATRPRRTDNTSLPDHFATLQTDSQPTWMQSFEHFAADAPQVSFTDPGLFVMPPLVGSREMLNFDTTDATFNSSLPAEWYGIPLQPRVGAGTEFSLFNLDHADRHFHDVFNTLVPRRDPKQPPH